jgi:hypothetical protein
MFVWHQAMYLHDYGWLFEWHHTMYLRDYAWSLINNLAVFHGLGGVAVESDGRSTVRKL